VGVEIALPVETLGATYDRIPGTFSQSANSHYNASPAENASGGANRKGSGRK
jgi:hypothetical protein